MEQEIWSNCCGAPVLDNWLCSDCKEHCWEEVSEIISVWVLDTRKWNVIRMMIPIQYDLDEWCADEEVGLFITKYLGHTSYEYMYNDDKEVDFEYVDFT